MHQPEVGDDPAGDVGVEHGALAEDLQVHGEVEAAAEEDGALCNRLDNLAKDKCYHLALVSHKYCLHD